MSDVRKTIRRVAISAGESVRIVRKLQELSQSLPAGLLGMPRSNISAIECGRLNLGIERAKALTRVLICHPAVLVYPGWDTNAVPVS